MVKKSRLVIGIIGIPSYDDEHFLTISMYANYKKILVSKNCIPFMISPLQNIDYQDKELSEIPPLTEEEKDMYEEMLDMCDGIILPGGYRMYNFYEFIARRALQKDIPVLGTCLGLQVLAKIDNGDNLLVLDETGNHKKRDEKYAHSVNIVKNTLLSEILNKDRIEVNSVHRYCVSHVNKFNVSAYSDDGVIEAIELPGKRFVLGVQWHPEKMVEYDTYANKIIDRFIDECKNYKNRQ